MRSYLIVDDSRPFAENLAEILRDQGDEAVVATNGASALELVRKKRFHALVTDMKMPTMNGARLVQEIHRVDPGLAAIIVTAYSEEAELSDAKQEGVLAVLPKPVPVEQLVSLLSAARRNGLVALVEDDLGMADNLVEVLRERGFSVVTAHSAGEAERLGEARPFAVLVDLHLPGSPRGEIIEQVSRQLPGPPIIVITGFPEHAPAGTPAKIFQKPFETTRLLQALEQLHLEEAKG
jgi:DNA-binding NtrC family response regulator